MSMLLAIAALALCTDGKQAGERLAWYVLCLVASILIFFIVFLVFFVRTPWKLEQEAVQPASPTMDAGATTAPDLSGQVDVLLAQERHISTMTNQTTDRILELRGSGNLEAANQYTKDAVEFKLPVLIESTLGKKEKRAYIAVIEATKEKAGDDWSLLYNVANYHLTGILTARTTAKLIKWLEETLEAARRTS